MRVLHAAAEVYPLLKTGGLADVVGALPAELVRAGCDVRLLLPGFPAILDGLCDTEVVARLGAGFGAAQLTVRRGRLPRGPGEAGGSAGSAGSAGAETLTAYVLDAPWLFDRPGNPYLGEDGRDWPDNARRFAAFGWVAAHLAWGDVDPAWRADILHAHDWHAGLAPAYLRAQPTRRVGSVFTIHNLAYQGRFALDAFRDLGLPPDLLVPAGLEFHGSGSFMKSGLVLADRLTTVSPRYAEEIGTPAFGHGLDGVLAQRRAVLSGILNGIDDRVWDPATDPHLPARYGPTRLAGKARCKAALQAELGLADAPAAPMLTMDSRLTDQKGTDLLLGALERLLALGAQLTVLGTGDRDLEAALAEIGRAHPSSIAVRLRYDEALAHRLIAAADLILVPSRFEPCGLTQMYGLRYGTLPVVRRVGGLADTVSDDQTGFVFEDATVPALTDTIERAIRVYRAGTGAGSDWRRLISAAMMQDHGWARSARAYLDVYRQLAGPAGE